MGKDVWMISSSSSSPDLSSQHGSTDNISFSADEHHQVDRLRTLLVPLRKFDDGGGVVAKPASTSPMFVQCLLLMAAIEKQLQPLYPRSAQRKRALRRVVSRLNVAGLVPDVTILDEFGALLPHYQAALHALVNDAVEHKISKEDVLQRSASVLSMPAIERPLSPSVALNNGRYAREFRELDYLGRGGFGEVRKVVSEIDGSEYAVKKLTVRQNCASHWIRTLREIKLMAGLDHANIIRYHTSWLESELTQPYHSLTRIVDLNVSGTTTTDSESATSPRYVASDINQHRGSATVRPSPPSTKTTHADTDSSDDGIVFQARSSGSVSQSQSADRNRGDQASSFGSEIVDAFVASQTSDGPMEKFSSSRSSPRKRATCTALDTLPSAREAARIRRNSRRSMLNWWRMTMYIQLELCEQTLSDWLSLRDVGVCDTTLVDKIAVNCLIRQTVSAVAYLHNHAVIHRDLKPSNIFLKRRDDVGVSATCGDFVVKVADFGLSRGDLFQPSTDGHSWTRSQSELILAAEGYTAELGTGLYAAPEQREGKHYGPAVDCFSLGIIITELYRPCSTRMERQAVLRRAGELGVAPEDVTRCWPHVAAVASRLLSRQPELRLTSVELAACDVFAAEQTQTTELERRQSKEIARLRHRLAAAERRLLEAGLELPSSDDDEELVSQV